MCRGVNPPFVGNAEAQRLELMSDLRPLISDPLVLPPGPPLHMLCPTELQSSSEWKVGIVSAGAFDVTWEAAKSQGLIKPFQCQASNL